jgi:hypothetical protein
VQSIICAISDAFVHLLIHAFAKKRVMSPPIQHFLWKISAHKRGFSWVLWIKDFVGHLTTQERKTRKEEIITNLVALPHIF